MMGQHRHQTQEQPTKFICSASTGETTIFVTTALPVLKNARLFAHESWPAR